MQNYGTGSRAKRAGRARRKLPWVFSLALAISCGSLRAQPASVSTIHADGAKAVSDTRVRAPSGAQRLARDQVRALYGRLPLRFEPNFGQADARAKFVARGPGYSVFLTSNGVALSLPATSRRGVSNSSAPGWVQIQWLGSASSPVADGRDQLAGRSNYFIGNNPNLWHTGIPNYAKVEFHQIYPGVDLIYYGNPRQLEYDFHVAPRANAKYLRFSLQGSSGNLPFHLDSRGNLVARIPGGSVRLLRPVAYQEVARGGRRFKRAVRSRYILEGSERVRIAVGPYDRSLPLVIDPALVYSTYLGGSGGDSGTSISVDSSGDAFITGGTGSTDFPTANPEQKSLNGASNVFVSELKPDGTGLVYSTYIGGSGYDKGTGIALDSSGNAYVTGYTSSPDFPVASTNGLPGSQPPPSGKSEAFVLELNSSGSSITYATYLGGNGGDFGYGIALDSAGDAYVTGATQSSNFPIKNAIQTTSGGGLDAFVSELNPGGTALVYSTYLGGAGADAGQAIAVDGSGNAYVTGFTSSAPTSFPITLPSGGYQPPTLGPGKYHAFVAKISSGGSSLAYFAYLGGSSQDKGFGIAVDSAGEAFVTGSTQSSDFPATTGAFQPNLAGNTNAFITKLNAAGSQPVYSTFLGGNLSDQGNGITLDSSGNAYVAGSTSSSNFPVLDAAQSSLGEGACATTCSNAFVAELNPQGSSLIYSTYLGGNGPDYGQAIALNGSGDAYITGTTSSTSFPAVSGAFQSAYAGTGTAGNAFVAQVTHANVASVALNPQKVDFGNQGQNSTSASQAVTLTNVGSAGLSISGISVGGSNASDFKQTNDCGSSVAAGGSQCTINVTFTPSTTAAESANLSIADSAAGSPQPVALSGTGTTPAPAATFSPTSLTFSDQLVGNTSAPQTVTLTNTGSADLTTVKITISGAFTQTNNCPSTLSPGKSCQILVTFSPTSSSTSSSGSSVTGTQTGAVSFTSNLTGTAPVASLTGTALPDFSLSSSGPSTMPLIGTDSVNLTVSAAAVLSAFSGNITFSCSSTVTCTFNPTQITPGQSTTVTVSGLSSSTTFPVAFTITGTSSGQSATTNVSINFQSFSISATPPLATITAGQSASYTVVVTPSNGFNQAVALSCPNGVPGKAKCSFSPASVTPSGNSPVSSALTITTTAHSFSGPRAAPRRMLPPGGWFRDGLVLLFLLILGFAAMQRERRGAWLLLGILTLLTLGLAACNNYYGFLGSNPAPTGTPVGAYTVTISGTFTPSSSSSGSSAATQSATVNLAVQ